MKILGSNWDFFLHPPIDEMNVIDPPPRWIINGFASLARRNEALTLTSNILSQTSSLVSRTDDTSGLTALN